MASKLKPVGQNGRATLEDLVADFEAVTRLRAGHGTHVFDHRSNLARVLGARGRFDLAKRVAAGIGEPYQLAQALGRAAAGLARCGLRTEAEALVDEALAAVRQVKGRGEVLTVALGPIAAAQRVLGRTREATATFAKARKEALAEKHNPTQPWPHLLEAYLEAGDVEGAAQVYLAPTASYSFPEAPLFLRMLVALWRKPGVKAALAALRPVTDEHDRARLLLQAAAEVRPWADLPALEDATRALPEQYRDNLLLEAAAALSAQKDQAGLARLLLLWKETIPHTWRWAEVLVLAGRETEARKVLKSQKASNARKGKVSSSFSGEVRAVAQTLLRLGDTTAAFQELDWLSSPEDRRGALRALSSLGRERGEAAPQAEALKRLVAMARKARGKEQVEALADLGSEQMAQGQQEAALRTFKKALPLADAIRSPSSDQGYQRRSALQTLFRAQTAAGDLVGVFAGHKKLRNQDDRDQALGPLVPALSRQGDLGGALLCLGQMAPDLDRLKACVEAVKVLPAAVAPLG